MLVLSRKKSESVVFPTLGISIRVLRSNANGVKLGIDAPKHLQVLRGEIATCDTLIAAIDRLRDSFDSHELRNRLNSLLLKLELLKRAERRGLAGDDLSILHAATHALRELDDDFQQLVRPIAGSPNCAHQGGRLLIVDDDINERELLSAVLTLQGFSVSVAGDGVEAIEHLNESPLPDAVLLDLNMPRLGGEETLRCIRTDDRLRDIKVFGVSGSAPREHFLPEGLSSFDAWFDKPLELERLLQLLESPLTSASHPMVANEHL